MKAHSISHFYIYGITELSGSVCIALDLLVRDSPPVTVSRCIHSGKSAIIRESNHGSGVCKEHYAKYFVPKSIHFVSRNWRMENKFLACGFSYIKIDYSDKSEKFNQQNK